MNPPNNRRKSQSDSSATRPNSGPVQPPVVGKPTVAYRADSANSPKPVRATNVPTTANAAQRSTAIVKANKRKQRILTFSLIAVAAMLVGAAWLAYSVVISTVGTVSNTIIQVMPTPVPVELNPAGELVLKEFPDWSKKDPVNILLLGLDERPLEEESRADTQIIVHIDPRNNSVAMMAIPRDLWVTIPRYGQGRINSAYQLGERDKAEIPGGGPSLAMATIKQNFGIQIDYFARVNFDGFSRVIDSLGGVIVDVPRPLVDNEYPLADTYGTTRVYIPAGIQHMDGRTALQYARSRHADSDLGRNYRQQQVLLGLRQQGLKLLSLDIVVKINQLAEELDNAILTNLQIEQVGALALIAREIGPEGIQSLVIEPPMVYEFRTERGADVLMPNWELIRPAVAQLFADPNIAREAPRVLVLNGTTVSGMAALSRDALVADGVPVAAIASAPNQGSYPATIVTDYTGGTKPRTLEAVLKTLGLTESDVVEGTATEWVINADGTPVRVTRPSQATGADAVDIVVTIGSDRITKATPTPTAGSE